MENQEALSYVVRPFIAADALGIVDCIRQSYGATYFNYVGYDHKVLLEENETGILKSFVAVSDQQEVVGHVALLYHPVETEVAEMALAVVKPSFRQRDCLSELVKYILNHIDREELTAVYVHSISTHTYSQRVALNEGLRVASILFHFVSPLHFRGIADENSERESFIKAVYYTTRKQFKIYAPRKHRQMIEKLASYQNMDCVYYTEDEQTDLPQQGAVMDIHVDAYLCAHITVRYYGKNVFSAISGMVQSLLKVNIAVVFLYLNLGDRHTAWCTEQFEQMGFIFAGIGPGSQGRPRLILQKLTTPYCLDTIQIADPLGIELLDYIDKQCKGR